MTNESRTSGERLIAAGVAAYLGWALLNRLRGRDLNGQVALITGGSRGLGFLLAREFAREGCPLVICARDDRQLEEAARRLRVEGADVLAVRCDVGDPGDVAEMVGRAFERYGRVDILVNNASIIQVGPLGTMTRDDFEQAMAANFWGTVHPTLELIPHMRRRGAGRIVNITSIGGKVAVPHLLPYDCAKFATVGFSQGLRAELAKEGISVTTVVPGLMRTGSPVNAFFKGNPEREWDWFSLSSATPLTTMSAERAAQRIVLATKRGEAEVTLSWQAKLVRLTHDLFPGTTADLLGIVNRLLPSSENVMSNVRGMELDTPLAPSRLTAPLNRAAREYNQFAGRPRPSAEHAESIGLAKGDPDR